MGEDKWLLAGEHARCQHLLEEICMSDLNCKGYFTEALKISTRHAELEEAIVSPIIRNLKGLAKTPDTDDLDNLVEMFRVFQKNYDRLLKDHSIMRKLLKEAQGRTYKVEVSNAIDEILRHMNMEEETVYPSVSIVGELLGNASQSKESIRSFASSKFY